MMRRHAARAGMALLFCAVAIPDGTPARQEGSRPITASAVPIPPPPSAGFTLVETPEDKVVTAWHSGGCGCSVCQG